MKKFLSLFLALLMVLGMLSGCQNSGGSAETTTEPAATEDPEEAKTLKILTLGHSLAVDACHMLAYVAATEGYESMVVGTLYYSGCPLYKHVKFLTEDSPEYNLYLSSTQTPNAAPTIIEGATMRAAVEYDYWDIIIMQGGVFEIAQDETYKNGDIQTIQEYVNKHKQNPNAIFGWHMPWATPTNNTLRDMYPKETNNYYIKYKDLFNDERTNFYNGITKCVGDNIVTDSTFQYLIPSGTAIENALSSYLEETDLHRDYAHATDLGRLIAAYTYYCVLTGVDHLDTLQVSSVPKTLLKSTVTDGEWVLTDMEKAIVLESVNNALANPLQMTQSQYTEAPAA